MRKDGECIREWDEFMALLASMMRRKFSSMLTNFLKVNKSLHKME
jgi:hypothetical protein